ncbi:hypothetical protein ACXGQW_00775 [Wenyingzhuangia sp. IMCC45533]
MVYNLKNIDFEKTIDKKRLIYTKNFWNYFTFITDIMMFGVLLILPFTIIFESFLRYDLMITLLIIASIILSILKHKRSNKVFVINTNKTIKENRALIGKITADKKLNFLYKNNNFLQAEKRSLFSSAHLNFILRGKSIYLNVQHNNVRFDWPSFFMVRKYITEIKKEIKPTHNKVYKK